MRAAEMERTAVRGELEQAKEDVRIDHDLLLDRFKWASWVRELRSCPEPRSGSGTAVAERQITQSALMISPWRTAN